MSQLTKLLSELHRRSIWQILGSYAVGAWLVLQLAETLSSLLGLPLWFGPGVIGLLAAGLPLVLLTSALQGGGQAESETYQEPVVSGTRRFFTWRNVLLTGVGVFLLFGVSTGGYLGLRQLGVGPFGTLQAKGVIDFEERIILAEFDNRSSDPSIGETVTALFRIDLAQSAAIMLLEPAQIAPVLQRMERAPDTPLTIELATEVAQREGIKAVLTGEVLPLGDGFVISIRLVAVADGSTLIAERETASEVADIPKAVDRLSAKLRERIGESLRTIQGDPALEDVTTASLEALRLYAQGVRANDAGDYQRGVSLLDQALAQDADFAMAQRKLGIILSNANLEPERAVEAFTRAYERRDQLTERERYLAEAAYYNYVANDQQAAISAYQSLLERYPTDGVALNNLAVHLQGLGRLQEAAEVYQRAMDLRTGTPASYSNGIFLLNWVGMHDQAEAAFRQFEESFPDHPAVLRAGEGLASSQFHYDRSEAYATRLLETRRGDPVWESVALFLLGGLDFVRGHIDSGVGQLVRGVEITQGRLPFMSMPPSLFRAQVEAQAALVFRDDADGALAILDRAMGSEVFDTTSGNRNLLTFAQLYARAGRPQRARSLIAEYEETVGQPPVGGLDEATMAQASGSIAIAEQRYKDAITHFRAEPSGWIQCPLCGVRELGEAYELAGQPDSALAVYERYLSSRALYRLSTDGSNLWQTLLSLGRLYEERGRLDDAERMYARFVEQWADADADLQRRVREARRVLDRLRTAGVGSDAEGT